MSAGRSLLDRNALAEQMTHYVALTPSQALDAIRALECAVLDCIAQGGFVVISGFGLFERAQKANGELYLGFRQAVRLREELNSEKPGL